MLIFPIILFYVFGFEIFNFLSTVKPAKLRINFWNNIELTLEPLSVSDFYYNNNAFSFGIRMQFS